jgi:hypothetical protein
MSGKMYHLSNKQIAEIIEIWYCEGLGYKEISERMNISISSIALNIEKYIPPVINGFAFQHLFDSKMNDDFEEIHLGKGYWKIGDTTLRLSEWARLYGISRKTLETRLNRSNMGLKEALSHKKFSKFNLLV